ncbi:uncharacterized protein LOC118460341 [Anopheles albimanus]|uniref:uncharacterized protein LOC118460341 n=1 Tax=Anopheles albimanus TaxID=7167 RepID=UPI0016417C7C|nr:uncharacterized protein LOC118460341 [Anopheles albimanus]
MFSTPLERFGQQVSSVFVDYCAHSSLAGVAHITDRRHHWTERVFWTICILIGWISALLLIRQYVELFQRTTISVAVENVDIRTENSTFPAVGICEMGAVKQVYPRLEALVEGLRVREDMEYSYDVEDFMLRIVFQNLYNKGTFASYCNRDEPCEECVPCPYGGYERFAALVRANCSELFDECRWNGEPFDCCHYFRPIQTTVGLCFLLNSIQTVNRWVRSVFVICQ